MVTQTSILIGVLIAIVIIQFVILIILLLRKPKESEHSLEAREWQNKDDFNTKISKIQKRLK